MRTDGLKIIRIFIYIIFVFLILTLAYFQIIRGSVYRTLGEKNCIRLIPEYGYRGRILDRKGVVLADDLPCFDAAIMPREFKKQESLQRLSRILKISPAYLEGLLKKNLTSPFTPLVVKKNIDKQELIVLEEEKLDLKGVVVNTHPARFYPFGSTASHILGYVNQIDSSMITKLKDYGYNPKDFVGYSGIEEYYDGFLRTSKGGLQVEVDNRGRQVRVIGYRVPQDGKDIQLTIDIRLQKLVGELISDQRAAIIIMNPHTGEILALASSPGFNPNIFIEDSGYSIKDTLSDSRSPLLNRAISGIYPAGSLFKVVVATAALENITHIPKFFCPGSINIGKRTYKCWNLHEEEDIVEAIIHSCNVFFYRLGLLVGPDLIAEYAHKFGLGNPSGIDLPYEKTGFIPTPFWKRIKRLENWYDGDTANLAIGQGELLITPLQAVRLMAAFANGGRLVTPHLIYALQGRQIKPPAVINLRLKDTTLSLMKMALKRVIADPSGTAYIAYKEDLEIAGKTGSAQVSKGRPHGWFAGFCPAKEPKIAFVVFLENGEAGYYACVLARQLFERMLSEGLL